MFTFKKTCFFTLLSLQHSSFSPKMNGTRLLTEWTGQDTTKVAEKVRLEILGN